MDVMATAKTIGLVADGGGTVFGTIEEQSVLDSLDALVAENAALSALVTDARARVLMSRSAGVEQVTTDSVFARDTGAREIQLRYRSEMGAIFTDLAIDVAMDQRTATAEPRVDVQV